MLVAGVSLFICLYSAFGLQIKSHDISKRQLYTSCNKGWFPFGNMCYGIGGKKKIGKLSWENAKDRCRQEYGGQLATIDSQELSDFLVSFILMDVRANMWIGMHDRGNESDYEWLDGTKVDFTNWEPGEPSEFKDENEDCVEVIFWPFKKEGATGMWNDISCTVEREFICQKKMGKQGRKNLDARFCPPRIGGWKFRTSCYQMVLEGLSWAEAEEYCIVKHSGHLVTINNFPTRLFLEYILKNSTGDMWIGIKIKDELQQQWSSGWYVAYDGWAEDPGDFTDGTCSVRTHSDEWTTISCKKQMPFICETTTVTPPSLKSSSELFCPEEPKGWRDIGGEFCYYFDTTSYVTWYIANFQCMRRGGTLVSIHSQTESDILQTFLIYNQYNFWIGLYRHMKYDEEFVNSDGTEVDFTYWDVGEPNTESEKCVELRSTTMRWNDEDCDHTRGFVCSIHKVPSNRTAISTNTTLSCSSSFSTYALMGIIFCVLIVAALLGTVVFYFRPHDQNQKKISGVPQRRYQKQKYRSVNEIVVKEDYYEDVA